MLNALVRITAMVAKQSRGDRPLWTCVPGGLELLGLSPPPPPAPCVVLATTSLGRGACSCWKHVTVLHERVGTTCPPATSAEATGRANFSNGSDL